ncbi:MAG: alpha/beta hydrolase [Clostridia bacterium]|nr:alpha/beta hydrolase [Clostridia bacterium]
MFKFLIAIVAIALIIAIGFGVITVVAVKESVIRPKNTTVDYDSLSEKHKIRYKLRQRNNQHLYDLKPEDLSLTDKSGNELKAWFVPVEGSKKFVIAVHGYKCNGPDECSHLLPFYNETLGFNYLLPDHVAHGRSEGKYISFGAVESENLLLWVDYLVERFGEDIEIVLHGISMGAATVMLANCSNPPKQVKAVVEDCGYTSAFDIIRFNMKKMTGLDMPHLAKSVILFCRVFFGYDMNTADCLGRMKDAKNPILFVHGTKDPTVPFEMGEKLYEACTSVEKDKLFVKGAIHAYCYYDEKQAYEEKMIEFYSKHLTDFSVVK